MVLHEVWLARKQGAIIMSDVKERATMITTLCGMMGYNSGEMLEAFQYIMLNLDEFTKPKEKPIPSKSKKKLTKGTI